MRYAAPALYLAIALFCLYFARSDEFYSPGVLGKAPGPKKKPLPRWLGRLWFLGIAAGAIYMGVKALVELHR